MTELPPPATEDGVDAFEGVIEAEQADSGVRCCCQKFLQDSGDVCAFRS